MTYFAKERKLKTNLIMKINIKVSSIVIKISWGKRLKQRSQYVLQGRNLFVACSRV